MIGQWNVRTLREPSRLAQLESQFEKLNVAVLGISEMRWRGKGQLASANGNVVLYSGKDDRLESGVGFIIAKDLKMSLKDWSPVSDHIITPRFFFTKIGKCLSVIQCYAPTEEADDGSKDEFYEKLTSSIQKLPNRDILVLTGDFNAKISSDNLGLTRIMGKHGIGIRNDNGERFIELCQTFDLVIGGTLFPQKNIHKYTWTSPSDNTKNQIDHIWRELISTATTSLW
ncbi:Craniofacial development protein 2 [Lucilia cuprina]|nr:Craniofacial development protein 2 [Lucilia cuprina]